MGQDGKRDAFVSYALFIGPGVLVLILVVSVLSRRLSDNTGSFVLPAKDVTCRELHAAQLREYTDDDDDTLSINQNHIGPESVSSSSEVFVIHEVD